MTIEKTLLRLSSAWCLAFFLPAASAESQPLVSFSTAPVQVAFPVKNSILTFFDAWKDKKKHIEIHVLKPRKNEYDTAYIGTIEHNGSAPAIESVLLYNVDADQDEELLVLVRWDTLDPAKKKHDAVYKTYVFDHQPANNGKGLLRLVDVEAKIASAGKQAPKDADAIRGLLKKLGY
ncbi:MAG: hypothetical protein WC284_09005 [Candidimonas sp.]|jgi:hypothetical protein